MPSPDLVPTHDGPAAPNALPRHKTGRWKRWRRWLWNAQTLLSIFGFFFIGILRYRASTCCDMFSIDVDRVAIGLVSDSAGACSWLWVNDDDSADAPVSVNGWSPAASWQGYTPDGVRKFTVLPIPAYSGLAVVKKDSDEYLSLLYHPRIDDDDVMHGFGFSPDHSMGHHRRWLLLVPHWSLLCLFAAIPTARLIAYIRHRRLRSDGATPCSACGYDLRGNPAATACPECGVAVAPTPQPIK